jgi:hypothetical protein
MAHGYLAASTVDLKRGPSSAEKRTVFVSLFMPDHYPGHPTVGHNMLPMVSYIVRPLHLFVGDRANQPAPRTQTLFQLLIR